MVNSKKEIHKCYTFNLAFQDGCGLRVTLADLSLVLLHLLHRDVFADFLAQLLSPQSNVATWRAWTCAAAAARFLSRTASAPSRWGCFPAAQSKACGPRRPASGSPRERRVRPHQEPGTTRSCLNNHAEFICAREWWATCSWTPVIITVAVLLQCCSDSNSRQLNTETSHFYWICLLHRQSWLISLSERGSPTSQRLTKGLCRWRTVYTRVT